ncbi:MAG: hypothetical protein D6778_08225 [Nitrospirae bacterium]|nr:MAG: hypothetical protein D6778_08225 [Nitrospirota bacterium]
MRKRFLCVLVFIFLSGCISFTSHNPPLNLNLSEEEVHKRIETLEKRLKTSVSLPEDMAMIHLELSYLYTHPSLKEGKDYTKALEHLKNYFFLNPENEEYLLQERLNLLSEVVSLRKKLEESFSCKESLSTLSECQERVSSLLQSQSQMSSEIEVLKNQKEELNNKIDQLLHIEIQKKKKKKAIEEK